MGSTRDFSVRLAVLPLLACLLPLAAQQAVDAPQALVVAASGAGILRQGTFRPDTARPGMVLFPGDVLSSGDGSVTFLACPGRTQQTLAAKGEVAFEGGGFKVRSGSLLDQKPVGGCFLPPMTRYPVASQQDGASATTRDALRPSGANSFEDRLRAVPEPRQRELITALEPVDAALSASPSDTLKRLERADLLRRNGLPLDAAEEMGRILETWPDASWARSGRFAGKQEAARAVTRIASISPSGTGQTYALLVGISEFQDPDIKKLSYAHEDALEMRKLLLTKRAGAIPPENIMVLINEKATRAAINAAIESHLLNRHDPDDTILLFMATHGEAVAVDGDDRGFIVAWDSSAKDLATTGIPMEDIRQEFEDRVGGIRLLILYADFCYAGNVGEIKLKNARTNKLAASTLPPRKTQVFGMLASQAGQESIEGEDFGGGHGAFTYFLLNGLNGAADTAQRGKVTMGDLSAYVPAAVRDGTRGKQLPKQIGTADESRTLADLSQDGITLPPFTGLTLTAARRRAAPLDEPPSPSAPPPDPIVIDRQRAADAVRGFEEAIRAGSLLPTDDHSAFGFLDALRAGLALRDYQLESDKLRVALEDRGQQVLVRYLEGEAVAQDRADFEHGRQAFEAAKILAPDSVYLDSRALFCQGRVAVFDGKFDDAEALLERSVGLDPQRAYAYNGLGIADLERANYDRAILAFRDAAARAPYWPYPVHNLAVAYTEKGDYANATSAYKRARLLAPRAAYVPYNLGLLYQRMHRLADAEAMYRLALQFEPRNAQVLNAIGTLKAAGGRPADRAQAETLYRQALALDAGLLAARHNLAVLLADTNRLADAILLWRENLARDPNHLPSRLGLARALAAAGRYDEAAPEYEKMLAARPGFVAARLDLADVYARLGKPDAAAGQLQQALQAGPGDAEVLEKAARVYQSIGRPADARSTFEKALQAAPDGATRKRIRAGLAKLKGAAK
jgi:tetratricopeptide (TPR) repeat protein/predicted nucleic acid-binding protein